MRAQSAQSGSALTELAIVAPLFILLMFWAQFFTDLGVLRLKADEAARFVLWEAAAHRKDTEIVQEVKDRFADLSSPTSRTGQAPYGVRSFKSVTVPTVTITEVDSKFSSDARVANPGSGGGFLSDVLRFVNNLLGKAVDAVLGLYNFNTKGALQATVTLQAQNSLFPNIKILGIDFSAPRQAQTIRMTARSPVMLVDVWKAWPGRWALGSKDVNATPQSTYGRGSTPEKEVAARLNKVAFFGLGGFFDPLNKLLNFIKAPGVTQRDTWANGGPVAMLPAGKSNNSWSPAAGKDLQRAGTHYLYKDSNLHASIDSPNRNQTDRARFTTPGEAILTTYWKGQGGLDGLVSAAPDLRNNPYKKAWQCRNGHYLGSSKTELNRWGRSFQQWSAQANPACR
jgi:hypothetical protein